MTVAPRYFELKTISLGFALQLFTIGYFEWLQLFWTFFFFFRFPLKVDIAAGVHLQPRHVEHSEETKDSSTKIAWLPNHYGANPRDMVLISK